MQFGLVAGSLASPLTNPAQTIAEGQLYSVNRRPERHGRQPA
jgi:hypothetical protein